MTPALVLDFGGVVTKTMFETHSDSEAVLGLPTGSLTWAGPFDPDSDAEWRAMQNDELTEREYWLLRTRQVGQLIGEDWTEMSQLLRATRADSPMSVVRPETLELIGKARQQGCKLAILSNELDLFYGPEFRAGLPFLDDFDAIVDATYTGLLKPDSAAYAAACNALGVTSGGCVFVDDQQRNVAGAIDSGMHVVHFDVTAPQPSCEQALDLLQRIRTEQT